MVSRLQFGSTRTFLAFVVFVRAWRRRGSSDEIGKSLHGGRVSLLPPKWRRWILGEEEPK
jgi:hypothetical protein